jgi:dipeptidyl aminopeptidase/acylaminoacyl peptidase
MDRYTLEKEHGATVITDSRMSDPRPVQLADFLTLRVVTDPRPSPDGKRAVCAVQTLHVAGDKYASNLWLLGEDEPRPLTRGTADDHGARWSPDGRRLAFVSARGGENGIWILDLDGGEPRRLLTWKNLVPTALAWSPDGDRVAFLGVPRPAKPEGEDKTGDGGLKMRRIRRPSYRVDGSGWLAEERAHIFVMAVPPAGSVTEPAAPRQLTDGPADDGAPAWSPDGSRIAFARNEATSPDEADFSGNVSQIHVTAADGSGDSKRVTLREGGWMDPLWSPDGRWIAATGTTHTGDVWGSHGSKLWLFSSAGSEGECLTPDLDRPVEDASATDVSESFESLPLFTPDGGEILFPISDWGRVALYKVALDGAGKASGAPQALWDGPRLVTDIQLSGETLVGLVSDALHPHEVFACRYRTGDTKLEPKMWTHFNREWLAGLALAAPEEFTTKAEDGQQVHGWYLPSSGKSGEGPPPALLQIHGGPHVQYAWTFMFEFQYLAALGYTVIYCNPRGSQGYGDGFALTVREEFGEYAARDLHAALDHVIAAGAADRDRVGVLGGSGGGYLTTWLVGHSQRFRAGCSQRALNDWRTFVYASDMGWTSDWQLGTQPWQDGERLRSQSPLVFAENIHTPLLIVHSERDERCAIEQAEQLFVWLRWQKRPVEFLRFPEESHGLSRMGTPSRRLERLRAIAGWFEKHLMETAPARGATAPAEVEKR